MTILCIFQRCLGSPGLLIRQEFSTDWDCMFCEYDCSCHTFVLNVSVPGSMEMS